MSISANDAPMLFEKLTAYRLIQKPRLKLIELLISH